MEPDLDGFRDAQVRLREKFGRDVTFLIPIEGTYPSGHAINVETGKPLDPTVEAVGSGWASGSAKAVVIDRPIADDDESVLTPAGWFEEGHMVLDIDPDDWDAVSAATMIETFDSRWEIRDSDLDGIEVADRRLIHVEKVSDAH